MLVKNNVKLFYRVTSYFPVHKTEERHVVDGREGSGEKGERERERELVKVDTKPWYIESRSQLLSNLFRL